MNKTAKHLAAAGRGGDTRLAHLTPGEVVVPRKIAPLALGLLSDAGIDPERYQVGRNANSRNPRTGLLEFNEDGAYGHESPGDKESNGGSGGTGGGTGNTGGSDPGLDAGREMMRQNAAHLGFTKTDGETVKGTLDNMRDRMREGGYKGTGISDTMSNMGVGYFDRAKRLGYGPAWGSFGEKALNTAGGLVGSLVGGPAGGILGSTLGTALTADTIADWGQQFTRGVLGGALSPALSGLIGPQLGSFASKKLADQAMNMAMANGGVGNARPQGPRTGSDKQGIGGLLDDGPRPMGQLQPQAVASAYQYTPGAVAAMPWNPIQWGNQYDPLMRG